jgi:hypothetical protein
MQYQKLGKEVNEQSCLREAHNGSAGPHWTVVPSKEEEEKEKSPAPHKLTSPPCFCY